VLCDPHDVNFCSNIFSTQSIFMKTRNFQNVSLLLCAIVFVQFSCGKGGYSNSGGGGVNNNPNGISMTNMTFSPSTKTVTKGTVVTWTNNDSFAHTVTSNDGTSFDSGVINGGGTYSYTANTVGTFNYHCIIHGLAMSGILIVQ
jgi:plastocyanin